MLLMLFKMARRRLEMYPWKQPNQLTPEAVGMGNPGNSLMERRRVAAPTSLLVLVFPVPTAETIEDSVPC